MTEAVGVPVALSSTQDTDLEFAKVDETAVKVLRTRFGPQYSLVENITHDELRKLIYRYYSLEKLIEYLKTKTAEGTQCFNRIALQFPDELVSDSAIVSEILDESLPGEKQIWILADTSYSPCCIDEVAAEHVSADIVVHFGDACLNPVEKISSAYIFGRPYLDLDKAAETFRNTHLDKTAKVCLMADVAYSFHIPELYRTLKEEYPCLICADVDFDKGGSDSKVIDQYVINLKEISLPIWDVSRILRGLDEEEVKSSVDHDSYTQVTQDYGLFYLGSPPDPKLLLLSTKFGDVTCVDPVTLETSHGMTPSLSRRYRSMMIARSASTVGILVNTLSLQNTRILLNKVAKWVKDAGKKHYMFVVGKPNVAKLANFEAIDVWCVLGCGQSGIILDSYGDYYKPIITPYELELALLPEVTWTGKWVTDFEEVMNQDGYNSEKEEEVNDKQEINENEEKDEFAPEFNPVTGKLVSSRPLRQLKHLEIELADQTPELLESSDSSDLVKRFSSALAVGNTVSTSAMHLQERAWTGLGSDYKEQEEGDFSEEGATVEEGRSGIARDYDCDRKMHNN
ncbi:DEKNAAC100339 [Brettanomyces naardenensis]|uniref:2-(3-amino-3-carboxypropyl)histidine synthase subunit 2 n=1 Tax=Brettanomyces naardenensis TaxID=13370 RepID=A0A448YGC8_BRENA|nr:DEKNAAC100339 [Brettanomyces naardenensis]